MRSKIFLGTFLFCVSTLLAQEVGGAYSRMESSPNLLDEGQQVFPKYGAKRTPHVFILQRSEGDLRVRYIGTIDDNYQDAAAVKTRYVE